jgi:hypothetical protein
MENQIYIQANRANGVVKLAVVVASFMITYGLMFLLMDAYGLVEEIWKLLVG